MEEKFMTKFFKLVDEAEDFPSLYVCRKSTPIPTIEEIIQRNHLSPYCADNKVVEISMEEFLEEHHKLLAYLSDSANDMVEWSPNVGRLKTWEYWESEDEVWE